MTNITAPQTLDGRKASPEAQLELRRRCIIYFRQGVKRAEIARRLGLSRQWVTKIIQVFQKEGEETAVQGKKRGISTKAAVARRLLTAAQERAALWLDRGQKSSSTQVRIRLMDCQGS